MFFYHLVRALKSLHLLAVIFEKYVNFTQTPTQIPGNLQKYISTNRSLLQYKTLPVHFSNRYDGFCLLFVKSYLKARLMAAVPSEELTLNVCDPFNSKF